MPRIIKFDKKEPLKIECGEKSVFICQCGLSKKYPFCDGNHKRVKDEKENKIYIYDEEKRVEIN